MSTNTNVNFKFLTGAEYSKLSDAQKARYNSLDKDARIKFAIDFRTQQDSTKVDDKGLVVERTTNEPVKRNTETTLPKFFTSNEYSELTQEERNAYILLNSEERIKFTEEYRNRKLQPPEVKEVKAKQEPKVEEIAPKVIENDTQKTIKEVSEPEIVQPKPVNKPVKKSEYKTDTERILDGTFNRDKFQKYGITHFKYADVAPENLVVTSDGKKVHKKCAEGFSKMQEAALKDGVHLNIISGYRSKEYQVEVFKRKFKDKNHPTEAELKSRLKYSAPAGFSEHHTGLAVDINSIKLDFQNTKEYKWLMEHAHEYGFEISFPKNNKQGLGFEPWHWRYVGDEECKKIFEQAKKF